MASLIAVLFLFMSILLGYDMAKSGYPAVSAIVIGLLAFYIGAGWCARMHRKGHFNAR